MPARPRRWRRLLGWSALLVLAAALSAGGYGAWLWQRVQSEQGIVGLDWQGLELSPAGLRLARLELRQLAADGRRLHLVAEALQLDWSLERRGAVLERIAVQRLGLDWQAPASPGGEASRLPTADALVRLFAWLPRQLHVARIDARLPCPTAACQLSGSLALQQPGAALLPASLRLELHEGEHRLLLAGALRGSPEAAELQLTLALDERPHLVIAASLSGDTEGRALHGTLQLPARPPAAWLHAWLAQMLGAAAAPLAQLPDDLALQGEWTVRLPAAWQPQQGLPAQLAIDRLRLQARLPQWRQGDMALHEPSAELTLSGQWQAPALRLRFADGSQIAARRLDGAAAAVRLDALRADLAGLQLEQAADGAMRLSGPLAVRIGNLQHARLKPQRWDWRGTLHAATGEQRLAGRLDNAAGLTLRLDARAAGDRLDLQAELPALALAGANPLASSLTDWPALLELSAGSLSASGQLRLVAGGQPQAGLDLQLVGATGIYDRAELQALDARLEARLQDGELRLGLPALRLARLNPGVPLGPLAARASYVAGLDAPQAGTLILYQLDGTLLGGRLRARPEAFAVAQRPLALRLQADGLELAELLKVYPAEGLTGSGLLDGELPLRLADDGLHVDGGRLTARPPGGVLQLRSERIRAFGRSNPALQLATTALEDFRYDRLDGQVDYAPSGRLLLTLQLSGRNPALEGGRPVNFTINLEENVPALLTSLQLSGRVNEAIQRRVQQRLQRRD
ncbi:YdbH domain-containing protein [Pseudomonas oryzae]|uniref:Dicarboxylate transport n=1 Tax=Pseudomonas oryzae TaxID=1392877 RepID=A0A1H1WNJ2_9PSED|nr:YdbH domain-containing protein [Pseudomonas oryzae]SDS98898.1 Dicarboxylate transport [Pseudomonas oryzae]